MAIYRILTLDGGGIRGILTATILNQLQEKVPGWLEKVDLIAGTSTGGILALGLAKGLTPAELKDLYYKNCGKIFSDSLLDNILDVGKFVGAQYSSKHLKEMIDKVIGSITLGELNKKVLIPAFDLKHVNQDGKDTGSQKPIWDAKFFHNFPGEGTDEDVLARDVALYTSAAPTYFPTVDRYIDGGVVANNPAMAALAQVLDDRVDIQHRPKLDEIRLISIGTGKSPNYIETEGKNLDWGYVQWLVPLIKIMMEGSTGLAHFQCCQLLGTERYLRINPLLTKGIELDSCHKTDELIRIGKGYEIELAVRWLRKNWMTEV